MPSTTSSRFHGLLRASAVVGFGALMLSLPAMAGSVRHTMSPVLAVGPQAVPAKVTSSGSGPSYGLFTCQLGLTPFSCYDPYQMRKAYQLDSAINGGNDGTGRTIVIVDAFSSPVLAGDLAAFDAFYGLPPANLTIYTPDGMPPPDFGWAQEIALDVEWSHAMAPGAKIALVLAKSNQDADILSAIKYAVDHNLGDVISMSFGENESCVDPVILAGYHDVFAAATQKNITLFASSADQGAALNTCDGNSWEKAVSSPASDPLVTGVGGTELTASGYCFASLGCDPTKNPLPGTYQSEIVWNEGPPFGDFQDMLDSTAATGGGFSVLFDEPPYQKGTDGLHGGKQRAVPDVGYNAAIFHGVLVVFNGGFYLFGGTSAGSPQWAAITAIADQRATKRLGFLNSAIYQIGKVKKTYPASFHDITIGNNSSGEFDVNNDPVIVFGYEAGPGWDPTTGTGSPIGTGLIDNLIKYVSPGDGNSAIATTKPKPHPKPIVPGTMDPH
jgi:subtilase family serine protease